MRILYLDCPSGISGDMFLAAVVGLGVKPGIIQSGLDRLGIPGLRLQVTPATSSGTSALQVRIASGEKEPPVRTWPVIAELIKKAGLPGRVTGLAIDIFRRLAEAEAKVHGRPLSEVHFHEVGAADSIGDIVGAALAIDYLKPDKIICSPLSVGRGKVKTSHGWLPVPAPATLEILKGVPITAGHEDGELVTPTGAALAVTLADEFAPLPEMIIDSVGYGAGWRSLKGPNVLRAVLGDSPAGGGEVDTVTVLHTQIDDTSPEVLGYTLERLFSAGALDAFFTPIQMKKNRPAVLLTVLAAAGDSAAIERIILEETSSIGLRKETQERRKLPRREVSCTTPFGQVRVKITRAPSGRLKADPEYEDCRRAALQYQVPIRQVYLSALDSPEIKSQN